jgi:CHAT domain-containing protein
MPTATSSGASERTISNAPLHFNDEDWAGAHTAYTGAIEAGADLLQQAYTEYGRRTELGEIARLFAADAYCLLCLGRPDEALSVLEQGKTRLLNEAVALGVVDVGMLPEAERAALRAAREARRELEAEMRLPPSAPGRRDERALTELLRQARAELDRVISTIRAARPDFMPTGLGLPALLELIPAGGALVAPFFTAKGSAAFVLPHGAATVTHAHVLALGGFTEANLHALLTGPAAAELGGWYRAYARQGADTRAWLATIKTTGLALWDRLMGPVHERRRTLGLAEGAPVLLLPQGGLGLLPLHAAWREVEGGTHRYFLEDYTVTYAPSGYALAVSLRRQDEIRRQHRALLAVMDPTKSLPFAPVEIEEIAARFTEPEPRVLQPNEASLEAVLAVAPTANYLHFACHGSYDWENPMQSGLVLAGGQRLSLADTVVHLDLGAARLVVLSACETGLTDIRQSPDEFLGLPAGFLQAGAPAVVSTLWPIADLSTMLLMERFYRAHLGDGLSPAAALREAQLWLRNTTAGELKLAERWNEVYRATADPNLAARAISAANTWKLHPDRRPFSHPYHWAALTVSGA